MATTNSIPMPTRSKLQATDAEERDGFVEYCKLRTCERMEVDRTDELEDADVDVDRMRVIAIESKIEWRGFTDEMKMFWIERGSIKSTLNSWNMFMKENNVSVPSVYATGPAPTPSTVQSHSH
ncbi:hypothetical protein BG011_008120 [Mortierella polycephala]|uniref:Uncharacterized protein n=1 Tax=Mortierella polycephala TaxID=41804 RepID=A0A9P6PRU1_9FUNG|nr:hypothetical protein BG011_008120 [Mortierella polycephala]